MEHYRIVTANIGEIKHVVSQEDRFAALCRPGDEHQVRSVAILGVDVLEREHEVLQVSTKLSLFDQGPLEIAGGWPLINLEPVTFASF